MRSSMRSTLACLWALMLLFPGYADRVWAGEESAADRFRRMAIESSRRGRWEDAIRSQTEASRLYAASGRIDEQVQSLHELAQAQQALGMYQASLAPLSTALFLARTSSGPRGRAFLLGSLSNAYFHTGSPDLAEDSLTEALCIAKGEEDAPTTAALLDVRGSMLAELGKCSEAAAAFQEGIDRMGIDTSTPSAMLSTHLASMLSTCGNPADAQKRLAAATEQWEKLGDSHEKAYGLMAIGECHRRMSEHDPGSASRRLSLAEAAHRGAMATAESIGDKRAISFAFGYLGRLLGSARRYDDAIRFTRKAIFTAQEIGAAESLYLWEWQYARLLREQGDTKQALDAYRNAVRTFQSVRTALSSNLCRSCPSSISQDSIKSMFYEFADLLLRQAAAVGEGKPVQPLLSQVRETLEMLKVSELQDYFHDPCLGASMANVTALDLVVDDVLVVYSIVFPDRLDLLVSTPAGIKRFSVPVDANTLTEEARAFRRKLEKRTTWQFMPHARRLYQWIVGPMEEELRSGRIQTIVFVLDGVLRTIPMAALHDGREFLIQRFAVAAGPGMDLTDPRPIERKKVKILAGGLTEGVQGYCPLTNVGAELDGLQRLYSVERLENRSFVKTRMEESLRASTYPVVHMATHGEFQPSVSESYLLTWDGKIGMDELGKMMKRSQYRNIPVELLTLSACRTAAGDERAALGLAGVAFRSGARSALATLWNVSDQAASDLVLEFYHQFKDPSLSKAKALQRAQSTLLGTPRYNHPFYWSPFLLIGNWL